jgi:hypothetical protein
MTIINNSRKSAISADVFMPRMTLTLTFSNGNEIVVDANMLNQSVRDAALMHGLKQKLVDAAAISRNLDTGASATIDDKYNAVKKIADRLMLPDGVWNEGRKSADAGSTAGVNSILLRALMQMTGRDEAYVRDYLSAKTKEQRAALRKNPRVVAIMAELSAATVVNGVNTDELLSELGVDPEESEEPIESPPVNIAQTIQSALAPTTTKKPNTRTSKKKLVSIVEE